MTFGTRKSSKKIKIKNLDCSLYLTSLSVGLRGVQVEAVETKYNKKDYYSLYLYEEGEDTFYTHMKNGIFCGCLCKSFSRIQ
jgi:hypothetical protein